MKTIRMLALLLALCLLLPMLFACGGENGGGTRAEGDQPSGTTQPGAAAKPGDTKPPQADFGNEQLIINVSVAVNTEQTFGAADIYSRGPATYGQAADSVQQLVFNRNKKLATDLGLKVTWQETNEPVGSCYDVIEKFVQNNPENSPDVFINDIRDVARAMLTGALKNLIGGKDNHLDFSAEGWYLSYMEGTTLDQEKMYIMAGDYFLDLLRYAFVTYVNRDLFEERLASFFTVSELYEYAKDGWWDYYQMQYLIEKGSDVKGGSQKGQADEDDAVIGLVMTQLFERAMTWSSGLSIVEWKDENGKVDPDLKYRGTPAIIAGPGKYSVLHDNFFDLFRAEGAYYLSSDISRAVTLFLSDRVLFVVNMLGEMESPQVRESEISRGVLPLPKYDYEAQEAYQTLIHNQAEIGCILANTRNFPAATAYMQAANTTSAEIQVEYYEQSLKLRYNEDLDTQDMLDLVKEGITDPFDSLLARLLCFGDRYLPGAPYQGVEIYTIIADDAKKNTNNFSSTWDKHEDGWRLNLNHLVGIFEKLK